MQSNIQKRYRKMYKYLKIHRPRLLMLRHVYIYVYKYLFTNNFKNYQEMLVSITFYNWTILSSVPSVSIFVHPQTSTSLPSQRREYFFPSMKLFLLPVFIIFFDEMFREILRGMKFLQLMRGLCNHALLHV